MFGYKFIIEVVWSGNILLLPASIVMEKYSKEGSYYHKIQTNKNKKYMYRLKPRFIKYNILKKHL
jgi:hypothetical protein